MENASPPSNAPRAVHLDARQVRTLAHPLRMRLLGTLRADGPATATTLAGKLDTNTGATSYHLRQLAEVGLVTEDPDRGTGRQRWWRAAHDISSFEPTDFDDDPDARAAVQWIQADQVRLLAEQAERWMAVEHGYSREWRDAAGMSDVLLTLGPARLRALNDELWQLLQRYRDEPVPDEPEAEAVLVFLAAFPRVEGNR
ncbi:helix-turn-helix domain-containing protein [Micromonospora peucetia]|uniref:Helix-turn-helix domain-containing protein n=1 Tax=Micromonospora peucetia TaxID=47871 RepID=A0A1C6W5F6_9ACTN|nr:helix-turn-helix domain-containing protein [Micromonospora peucetia]MCX4385411.1 helix-turn-helix domain-containing protein [Micromonospora peucetia]WSA32808.1 helix-turn-helix domain-containing protein [Micromonospora peucetia]SCL73809.1 transcriptional regulator, ArsR family [Micromonospora peucetia]